MIQTEDEVNGGEPMKVDIALVLECIKGGELYYNLRKYGKFTPMVAYHFFSQVVDAIAHMHKSGYCHRDLKPWNIMLSNDLCSVKVIDFSYATPIDLDKCPDFLRGFLSGTKHYMAPEQFQDRIDNFSKLDVWALAVLLMSMLTVDFAFESPNDPKFESFDPELFLADVAFENNDEKRTICDMLRRMLVKDIGQRMSIEEVQQMCIRPQIDVWEYMNSRLVDKVRPSSSVPYTYCTTVILNAETEHD